jgi:hypothetical protein
VPGIILDLAAPVLWLGLCQSVTVVWVAPRCRYEEKVRADEVDDREGNRREPMPEFIQDFFVNQYGLKSLARKHLGKLVTAVRINILRCQCGGRVSQSTWRLSSRSTTRCPRVGTQTLEAWQGF